MNLTLLCFLVLLLLKSVSGKSIVRPKDVAAIETERWKSISVSGNKDKRAAIRRRFISQPSLSNFVFDSNRHEQT